MTVAPGNRRTEPGLPARFASHFYVECNVLQTFVYVSCSQSREIQVFSLDVTTGELAFVQSCPMPASVQPLRISPDKKVLFAGMRDPHAVASLAVDAQTGKLTLLGQQPVAGPATFVASDQNQRMLFCASWGGNNLSCCPLDAQGVPQPVSQTEHDLPRAHAALTDASNRWLLVPMLGVDAIRIYAVQADGRIVPNDPPMVRCRPGSGPRHLVFSNDNRRVYCLNELDGSVDRFDFDASTGTLTPRQSISMLPPANAVRPWAAELRATPDGRFLYATDRGLSVIAAFAIDPASGQMTLIDHFSTETRPRGMGIDASGCWLIAAGQLSGQLTVYAIDTASGRLNPAHHYPTGQDPICVEITTF